LLAHVYRFPFDPTGPMNDQERPDPRQEAASPSNKREESLLGPHVQEELMGAAAGRITALEAELDQLRDKWLRAEAENQNIARRMRAEVENTRQYAVQKFARDVVDSAENFSRALMALPEPAEDEPELTAKLREGLMASERAFQAMLERNGVAREDATGKPFDPERHQAMAEATSEDVPAGHVLQAYTPAWTLNGRLLKPAMVVVSKGAAAVARPDAAERTVGTEG
jgi:molecular chaperone GrpE